MRTSDDWLRHWQSGHDGEGRRVVRTAGMERIWMGEGDSCPCPELRRPCGHQRAVASEALRPLAECEPPAARLDRAVAVLCGEPDAERLLVHPSDWATLASWVVGHPRLDVEEALALAGVGNVWVLGGLLQQRRWREDPKVLAEAARSVAHHGGSAPPVVLLRLLTTPVGGEVAGGLLGYPRLLDRVQSLGPRILGEALREVPAGRRAEILARAPRELRLLLLRAHGLGEPTSVRPIR